MTEFVSEFLREEKWPDVMGIPTMHMKGKIKEGGNGDCPAVNDPLFSSLGVAETHVFTMNGTSFLHILAERPSAIILDLHAQADGLLSVVLESPAPLLGWIFLHSSARSAVDVEIFQKGEATNGWGWSLLPGPESTLKGIVVLGGNRAYHHASAHLSHTLSRAELSALYAGGEHSVQSLQFDTFHDVPKTRGSHEVLGIAERGTRSVVISDVHIGRGAVDTESVQNLRGMILGPSASIHARPALHIACDRVKAKHGSTTSSPPEHELGYIESRGVDPEEARRLWIGAFLRRILERIPKSWREDLCLHLK